jgi:hypothetical protein
MKPAGFETGPKKDDALAGKEELAKSGSAEAMHGNQKCK